MGRKIRRSKENLEKMDAQFFLLEMLYERQGDLNYGSDLYKKIEDAMEYVKNNVKQEPMPISQRRKEIDQGG